MAGYPRSRLTSLIIGTKLASGTALPDVPIPIPSQADARQLFGFGSMLDAMVESFTSNNFAQELWVVPIDEASAGVAATGKITVTTPATKAGTLPVYVGGRRVQVFIAAGETVAESAIKIAAAINKDMSMPVIASQASSDAPAVDLTCKWKGVEGNNISIMLAYGGLLAAEQIPIGLGITLTPAPISGSVATKLSGGTGSPNISNALTNLGDSIYEYVATGFSDSTSLALLEEEYGFSDLGRWGWLETTLRPCIWRQAWCGRRSVGLR